MTYSEHMKNIRKAPNAALMCAILGDVDLAFNVKDYLDKCTNFPEKKELMKIRGVGDNTANKILAMCEMSARYIVGSKADVVSSPEDLAPRLAFLKFEAQEKIVAVSLNSANNIIDLHTVTVGVVDKSLACPREVFRNAIADNATSIILAHNHPSGNLDPSEPDIALTRTMCAAGGIVQIPVLDHIIVSRNGMCSICRKFPDLFEKFLSK